VSIEPENDTGPAQDLQPRLTTPDPTVGPTSSEIAASLRRDAVLLRKQADQAEGLRKHNAARAQALANAADERALEVVELRSKADRLDDKADDLEAGAASNAGEPLPTLQQCWAAQRQAQRAIDELGAKDEQRRAAAARKRLAKRSGTDTHR